MIDAPNTINPPNDTDLIINVKLKVQTLRLTTQPMKLNLQIEDLSKDPVLKVEFAVNDGLGDLVADPIQDHEGHCIGNYTMKNIELEPFEGKGLRIINLRI